MRLKALLLLPIFSIIGVTLTVKLFGSLFIHLLLKTIKRDKSLIKSIDKEESVEMWKCRKCAKPVYFAERKSSLGYDWHPQCLTCEECGKRLNPGQHAEHKGIPYCYIPCYGALFGPTLYGHGSRVESHSSFGNKMKLNSDQVLDKMLETKLKEYNQYYEGKSNVIHYRERNGKFILEGSLRIYWDVSNVIQLKEDNDDRILIRRRSSYFYSKRSSLKNAKSDNTNSISNSNSQLSRESSSSSDESSSPEQFIRDYKTLPVRGSQNRDNFREELKASSKSFDDEYVQQIADSKTSSNDDQNQVNQGEEVVFRRQSNLRRSRVKLKRRCSINGHFYNRETSTFTPAHGSVTSVWISSLVNAPEVINLLLEKFKVTNKPEDFALFVLRDNGECKRIQDHEFPLVVRVMLGPNESAAKVFIFNKSKNEISSEVAQYLRLRNAELQMFLKKFEEEEIREVNRIKKKYTDAKKWIKIRIKELESSQSH